MCVGECAEQQQQQCDLVLQEKWYVLLTMVSLEACCTLTGGAVTKSLAAVPCLVVLCCLCVCCLCAVRACCVRPSSTSVKTQC